MGLDVVLLACPEGVAVCNDTSSTSALVPLFPIVMLLAVLIAMPLARYVPHSAIVGWLLVVPGIVAYFAFAASGGGSIAGMIAVIVGVAFLRGSRRSRSASLS